MAFQKQLRWGGLFIILVSILMTSMNVVVYLGYHNAATQAVYGASFAGLILAATIIHLAQAQRAGLLGLLAFLIASLSLLYANIVNFLTLAELSGIEGAQQTSLDLWNPAMQIATYGVFAGWMLLGASIAQAGVLPRGAGILIALGIAMQLIGPLSFLITIGGSVLFSAGLIWTGWALWSGNGWNQEEPGLSELDRKWGGPLVVFAGLMFAADAMFNMLGGLSLASGITHVISYTTCILIGFLLYAAHGKRVSWAGFAGLVFIQLGAALYMITAFLILAQLAGVIDNNIAMMASWVEIPVGRYGGHMVTIGTCLLAVEAIRSGAFPSASGWLVLVGIALALPFAFTVQAYFLGIFWVIGAIVEGIGIAWMGVTLMREKTMQRNVQLAESAS